MPWITSHSAVTQPIRRCLRHPTRESNSSGGFREYLQPFSLICAVGQMRQGPQPLAGRILSCVRSEADAAPQWNDALFLRYDRFFLVFLSPVWCPCLVRALCPCPNNTALFEGADLVLTQAAQLLTSASNMVEPTNCFSLPLIGKYGSKISPSVFIPIKLRPVS
ncbi:hypothetical protein V8F44DRAFT_637999 [Aspergillus fumigatus]